MAWPLNARFLSFTSGVTRISAACLNAIQDAIIDRNTRDAGSRIQQTWATTPVFAGTSATVGDFTLAYPAAGLPAVAAPDANYIRAGLTLQVPGAGDLSSISTKNAALRWQSGLYARFEVDLSMSAIGANNLQVLAGLASNTPAVTHFNGALFTKNSADTNWQCYTDDGTTRTANQTGYVATPPVANTVQRLRIDCYGSAATGGARAEFYINDSLVCTNTSNLGLSTVGLYPWVFVGNTSAGANANTVRVGVKNVRF